LALCQPKRLRTVSTDLENAKKEADKRRFKPAMDFLFDFKSSGFENTSQGMPDDIFDRAHLHVIFFIAIGHIR